MAQTDRSADAPSDDPCDAVERNGDGLLKTACCGGQIITTAQPFAAECDDCGQTIATGADVIGILAGEC